MKTLLSALFCFILLGSISGQLNIEWQKTLGGSDFDEASSIQQTSDNGYIVAGSIVSNDGDVFENHGGNDFWVVKLDEDGFVEWKKSLGGSNNDIAFAILQTNDYGFIVAGSTESNNWDVSGNHGGIDAWIVKLSNTGVIEWATTYGGSNWEAAHSIQQTNDGGYVFAGIAQSVDGDVSGVHGDLDFWVVKLTNTGLIEWQKAFGGSSEDIANSIKQTIDGGYIVAGRTKSADGDVSLNHGNVDYWIVKLNNIGNLEWQKSFGGHAADTAEDIFQSNDSGYVVTGYAGSHNTGDITGHHGSFDNWVVKINNVGDLLWQKAFGGSDADYGRSIQQTSDGMFVIAGSTKSNDGDILETHGSSEAWLIKVNIMGELVWQKTLGGTNAEAFFSFKETENQGYIAAGYAWSNDGDVSSVLGYNDFWVVKLSPESSGTSNAKVPSIEIFPNPASSTLTLQFPSEESSFTVIITDLLGREISRQTISNNGSADIAKLPNGLYLLTATSPSGKIFSGKFRKQE